MNVISIDQAKNSLSQLVQRAKAGEEVYIGAFGNADAKLVPVDSKEKPAKSLGMMAGEIKVSPEFDASLPDDIIGRFE